MEDSNATIVDGEIVIEESTTPLSSSWSLIPISTEEAPAAAALSVVAHSGDEERSCRACKQRPCRGGPKCREVASLPRPAATPRARKPRTPSEGGASGGGDEGPSCRVCKQRPCRNGPKCRAAGDTTYNGDVPRTLRAIAVAPAVIAHNPDMGGALPDLGGDGTSLAFAHAMGGEGVKRPREYDDGDDCPSPLPNVPVAFAHAVAIDSDGTLLSGHVGEAPSALAYDAMDPLSVPVMAVPFNQGAGGMPQPMGPL